MNLGTPVLDLSNVVAMLSSFGIVTGVISGARILFLDDWLSRLSAPKQNVWLIIVNVLANFLLILGFSVLLFGVPFGPDLLRGSVLATLGAATGSHFSYNGVKSLIAYRLNAAGISNDVKTGVDTDPTVDGSPDDGSDAASLLADEPISPAVAPAAAPAQ